MRGTGVPMSIIGRGGRRLLRNIFRRGVLSLSGWGGRVKEAERRV